MNNPNQNNYYAVIMAGGIGSRFWPVSTSHFPKQFIDLMGTGKSLLQHTYQRLRPIIGAKNILISTNQNYKELVLNQLPEVSEQQLLLEPAMRNTAPAILYAAMKIYHQNPEAVMLIAPSDHWIDNEAAFLENLKHAFDFCLEKDVLMTMGIVPTYPNTGYGYIQFEKGEQKIKKVNRFTEKPNLENAQIFIESGEYLWNAGIFIWSAKSVLEAFENFIPNTFQLFNKGNQLYNTPMEYDFIIENYPLAENISVDYAVLEKAENVKVIPVDMGWNDLGTWGALHQKLEKDMHKNVSVNASTHFINANDNIVYTGKDKKVIIKGLEDYIVVDTQEILLILPKKDEQSIKEISKLD